MVDTPLKSDIDRRRLLNGEWVNGNGIEVWRKIFGTINTREKFLDHRLELAINEWARMKANDSLEWRNCHSAQSMDMTRQSPCAVDSHQRFLFTEVKTCIDCHKGIAHRLPDMRNVPGWL